VSSNSSSEQSGQQQQSEQKVYGVLYKDNKAHVVQINNYPREGQTQYGYVFFDKSARTPGPVRHVNKVNMYNRLMLIQEKK